MQAGQARLAAYAARGYDPHQPVTLSSAHDARSEAAAITTAVRHTGTAEPALARWEDAQVDIQHAHAALEAALTALPRPRHLPQRMTRIWWQLALDRLYYQQPDLDALEPAAWTLLSALPDRRCPGSAPRQCAAQHNDWARHQLDQHHDEIEHLAAVSNHLRTLTPPWRVR